MNIVVCIKQVPGTTKVDIDETTGVLIRDGVDSKFNPYDLFAIEAAMKLKEQHGGMVKVMTMGPPQAVEVIKEAYMMGADEGIILSDKAFAGADVLSTSYAISQCICKLGKTDLIICGKQTTDGDTAQVGPEVAENLDIPHSANVTKIIHVTDHTIRVEAAVGESLEIQDISLPCLITVEKDINIPRLPSYKLKLANLNKEVMLVTLNDLDNKNPKHYGLNGSPTQVERIFTPETDKEKKIIKGTSHEVAEILHSLLSENKFI